MKVKTLVEALPILEKVGALENLEIEIKDLAYNTKTVEPGVVFFALKGRTSDGAAFIDKAYALGGRVFISQTRVSIPEDALLLVVEDSRKALSLAAHLFFGKPSQTLTVVGVTGTKGKTTTTTLLYKVLKEVGLSAGVIGTNGIYFADQFIKTANTTPESYELHKIMRQMVDAGIKVCFMEVSSQGLMMSRVEDIAYDIAVFTNMAVDHIGDLEHPTFEDYLYWKTRLFDLTQVALINQDDAYARHFSKNPAAKIYGYAVDQKADFSAQDLTYVFEKGRIGMQFQLEIGEQETGVLLPAPGKFNVYNALVVVGVAQLLGLAIEPVVDALAQATVPGRMELIPNDKGVLAILDYAHNGFSLENVIETLRHYRYKRLLVLFGSVGDRSQLRRKELGDVVAKYADLAMITSDNPGHEDPEAIIDDIQKSFVASKCQVYRQADRAKAIAEVVALAQEGDILIFAGKGHETYQLIGNEKVAFNEKAIIEKAFKNA